MSTSPLYLLYLKKGLAVFLACSASNLVKGEGPVEWGLIGCGENKLLSTEWTN